MRIIAGTAKGRPIVAPHGTATRPTSDKVRAAVFNVLGQFFDGGQVLDLYAGTGAFALEALSRGMDRAVCVERDRKAGAALLRNAEACGFAARVDLRTEPVERVLAKLPEAEFSLAFLDPPYGDGPEAALALLAPVLVHAAIAVAEHHARRPPAEGYPGLALVDRRDYGTAGISIYRRD